MSQEVEYVTQWFGVGVDDPSKDKPGLYEIEFTWPGRPIIKIHWNGKKWGRCGKLKASPSWGDKWRGLYAQHKEVANAA